MLLQNENHVAEALDKIISVDAGGCDHEIAALLGSQIEIIRAAIVIAVRAALAVAVEFGMIADRIDNAVIVDVETGDETRPEIGSLALLAEVILLVDLRIAPQLLLGGCGNRQECKR